jgi:uncharacterized protein YfaS (alpha-2-macroglobulin family)
MIVKEVTMLRSFLLILFMAVRTALAEGAAEPQIELFTPEGTVKGVRQVTARFSEAMVALGSPSLPSPFEVECPVPGTGRWADTRNWVYDFDRDLPGGLVCRFRLKEDARTEGGRAVTGKTEFGFDTGGPALRDSLPESGDEGIDEQQVFILAPDGPVKPESVLAHARCEVSGIAEQVPVEWVAGEEREKILGQRRLLGYSYHRLLERNDESPAELEGEALRQAESSLAVLRCRRAFPPEAEVRLVWGSGIESAGGVATVEDQVFSYKVRPAFRAEFTCQRVNAQADCVPLAALSLSFNSPVRADDLNRIRMVSAGGKVFEASAIDAGKTPYSEAVKFPGPFPEKETLRIQLPENFRDSGGRPLENAASFPMAVATDEYPPLAKFAGEFGIIERKTGGVLPVTLRNLEPAVNGSAGVPGRMRRMDEDDAEIVRWLEKVKEAARRRTEWIDTGPEGEGKWKEETGSVSVFGTGEPPEPFTLPKPLDGKDFEVVGIPLEKSGFYVVELASPILGRALLGEDRPRYVATAALVTNLAVHFKWGREASVVWVTSLDDAGPVAGAAVRISDYCSGKLLWQGETGQDGVARVGGETLLGRPHGDGGCYPDGVSPLFVSARTRDDFSFTASFWNGGIQPTDFNLRTGSFEGPDLVHTVFDRTLFRAGDTVSMKHFLRRHGMAGFDIPADFRPDSVEITHYGSGQRYPVPVSFDGHGIGETAWKVPVDAKLGEYTVTLSDGRRRESSGTFHVEQFRVPTMRAVIQPPEAAAVNVRSLPLDLFVGYLSGGGAGNLPVKLRTMVETKTVRFPGYEDYDFDGEPLREGVFSENDLAGGAEGDGAAKPAQVLALTLDAQGARRAAVAGLPVISEPRDLVAELEYPDANGERSAVTQRIPLWPANLVLGVRTDGWVVSRDQVRFKVVALDLSGKPVANRPVSATLYQRSYFSYRKRLIGGFYGYDNQVEVRRIGGGCTGRTDELGLLACTVAPEVAGEILIQASARDDRGNEVKVDTTAWIAGEEDWWFEGGASDRIDLLPERNEYEAGQSARFQVRMPFRRATALVTVEREGVVDHFVTELSGKSPVVEVPIRDHYAPNVFVSVLAVRGRVDAMHSWLADMARKLGLPWSFEGGTPNALADLGKPAYRLGMAEIRVDWAPHRLDIKVQPAAETFKVRETAKVKLSVVAAKGGPLPPEAEVAVAAVDEGLLELKPNRSWQLLEKMMGLRSVEVYSATAQMQVVGKRHYGRKAFPHGGGGGRQTARELFDPLLLWKGRLPLNARGEAEVEIPLNDALTSFRVVAVAHAGLGLFGTGSGTIRTTQDLILHSGLPSMIRENDRLRGIFTVRNASDRSIAADAVAKVDVDGRENLPELSAQTAELPPGAASEIAWEITAPVDAKRLTWEVSVRERNGGAGDRLRVFQEVLPVNPVRVYQATLQQLDAPLAVDVAKPEDAVPGRGGVRLNMQARLGNATAGVSEYMAAYPYNCLEQQVSRAVALRDRLSWDAIVQRLPAYLDKNGLAKYFPSDWLEGSDTLTAYVLAVAHEAGWEVPEQVRNRMAEALAGFVEGRIMRDSALPTADLAIRKLAAVEALARHGLASGRLLDSISVEPNLWPTSAVLDWYSVLKRVKDIPERDRKKASAEQILRSRLNFQGTRLGFSSEKGDSLWWLMISGDVNAVRTVLQVIDEPSWRADVPRLVRGALERQARGRWDTTPANAWGVLALEKFSAAFEAQPVTGRVEAELDGEIRTFDWTPKLAEGAVDFPWPEAPRTLTVSQAGQGKPWITVQSRAALPLKAPLSSGYRLTRTVIPVEQKQPGVWTRGDVARVKLDLESQADMTWAVVDDPVPAGATILGSGLGRDSEILNRGGNAESWVRPAFEERRFDAFRAYYRFLPKGRWTLEYTVRYNGSGRFELPPTRVEALYSPEMFGEYPNEAVEVGN